jgi:hypothetical protein
MEFQSKLAEYEDVVRQLMLKLEQLAAENTRLRSEKSDALSVCQEVYSDPAAPAALRLKAAGLALQFEVPRILPEKAAIDATCEEIEPLAQAVERQRARMNRLLALPLAERERLVTGVGRDDGDGDAAAQTKRGASSLN